MHVWVSVLFWQLAPWKRVLAIAGLQPILRDSADKGMAVIMVDQTKEANEKSLVTYQPIWWR